MTEKRDTMGCVWIAYGFCSSILLLDIVEYAFYSFVQNRQQFPADGNFEEADA